MRREPAAATINIRVPKAKKGLIDQAADALGMKRTEFMLQTLCERAHEVLADRTEFHLDAKQIKAFNKLVDEPVSDAALRMLTKRAPWER
jgi:uncharacterized protein (DUF1778 family)